MPVWCTVIRSARAVRRRRRSCTASWTSRTRAYPSPPEGARPTGRPPRRPPRRRSRPCGARCRGRRTSRPRPAPARRCGRRAPSRTGGPGGRARRVVGGHRAPVLQPVQEHGAAARGEQVAHGDRVDRAQPLLGVPQVLGVVGARGPRGGRQPAGEAAGVQVRAEVGAGPQHHVQPLLGGRGQEAVQVAHPGEVVHAGRGGVEVPGHGHVDRVEAVGAQLLQNVPPQRRARQPERVHLGGPQHQAPVVDQQGVPVEGDVVASAVGGRRRGRRSGRHDARPPLAGRRPAAAGEREAERGRAGQGGEGAPAELQGSASWSVPQAVLGHCPRTGALAVHTAVPLRPPVHRRFTDRSEWPEFALSCGLRASLRCERSRSSPRLHVSFTKPGAHVLACLACT